MSRRACPPPGTAGTRRGGRGTARSPRPPGPGTPGTRPPPRPRSRWTPPRSRRRVVRMSPRPAPLRLMRSPALDPRAPPSARTCGTSHRPRSSRGAGRCPAAPRRRRPRLWTTRTRRQRRWRSRPRWCRRGGRGAPLPRGARSPTAPCGAPRGSWPRRRRGSPARPARRRRPPGPGGAAS
ncbi:Os04g0533250 [Oryza sativa Japonica Group]|uniref:Os04g0533250 protein n=1 Tax=Oryza sativa subsp. japonica TaxID=39947 RepID=A0A0P0WCZ6_ORYSJ|nr:hypothetical protein EE612_024599 [Oryza sativa]BAS90232.1 Os04g0533250 [Oryza sativa Japonica Group]